MNVCNQRASYFSILLSVNQWSLVFFRLSVEQYQDALGPLLNAKRLQQKLGWATFHEDQPRASPPASSHWFYTLVALLSCFQEVEQLEEARDHCERALRVLVPAQAPLGAGGLPQPPQEEPRPQGLGADASHFSANRPHPLLLPLSRAMVRLSWQTGRDKRQWEELLHHLQEEEEEAGLDGDPTIKAFLLKHSLEDGEAEG